MNRDIILHFSTKDVARARAFYTALGFTVNAQLTGEVSVCIVMSNHIQVERDPRNQARG